MRSLFLLTILVLILSSNTQQDSIFSYYHTTSEINKELNSLKKNCEHFSLDQVNDNPDLRIAKFNTDPDSKKRKAFVLFGEHPRELISPETGLNLAKALCGESNFEYNNVDNVLDQFEVQLMINANPVSRDKVEQGEYCLRENENDVDINRNYDAHWEYVNDEERQTSSGPKAFSEIETQKIKKRLETIRPEFFLTVHSGTLGLYTPYAYSEEDADENEDNMLNILKDVNARHCKDCGVGSAGREVGYLCPGTSLDWVYDDLDTRYSFAMEIYDKNIDLQETLGSPSLSANKGVSFLEKPKEQKKKQPSCFIQPSFLQTSAKTDSFFDSFEDDYTKCFQYFNPEGEKAYNFYVDNWTSAILSMMDQSASHMNDDTFDSTIQTKKAKKEATTNFLDFDYSSFLQ